MMAALGAVLKQLKRERVGAERDLRKLTQAIRALAKLAAKDSKKAGKVVRRGRRNLSLAARRKIAAAQKARWAKVREKLAKRTA
jgi:hypothetical protein